MGYLKGDASAVRGVAVADIAAMTSSAPAAMTQAAITGGESPTEAEFNALRTDVVNVRATLALAVADIATLRAKVLELQNSLQGGSVIAA